MNLHNKRIHAFFVWFKKSCIFAKYIIHTMGKGKLAKFADMAEYLYGKKMYGADKDVIISFLKQAP